VKTILNPEKFQDNSITGEPGSQVNSQKVEISERTLSVIAFGFAIAAIVTALWSMHEADRAALQARQLQIQVMDQNALMIREGLKQPGDVIYGPAGNLEYQPREKK
jgi:hypothetical protein